jgi:hypothetical protein
MRMPGQVSTEVIIAAYRRGWFPYQIAFAAGVSRQRIDQRIKRYESKFGSVEVRRRRPKPRLKAFWRCAVCGKTSL